MNKIVGAVVAVLMLSGVAMADSHGDFTARQSKMLGKITEKLEAAKDDAEMSQFLTDKKACVEAATDVAGLDDCYAKFPPPQAAQEQKAE